MLRLLREERTTDPRSGAEVAGWKEGPLLRAERIRHTAQTRVENHELFADYKAEYRLRRLPKLTAGMRVRDITTGTLYSIVGVFPDTEKEMQTISCDRVND